MLTATRTILSGVASVLQFTTPSTFIEISRNVRWTKKWYTTCLLRRTRHIMEKNLNWLYFLWIAGSKELVPHLEIREESTTVVAGTFCNSLLRIYFHFSILFKVPRRWNLDRVLVPTSRKILFPKEIERSLCGNDLLLLFVPISCLAHHGHKQSLCPHY
jgi:hypothetical protein